MKYLRVAIDLTHMIYPEIISPLRAREIVLNNNEDFLQNAWIGSDLSVYHKRARSVHVVGDGEYHLWKEQKSLRYQVSTVGLENTEIRCVLPWL